jgi:glycerophosphoryl diester phosphodiesterase
LRFKRRRGSSRVRFYETIVEIKSYDHPDVESILVELLERTGRIDSVFLSSFGHGSIVRCKRLSPSLRVGLLYDDELVDYEAFAGSNGISLYSLHIFHGGLTDDYAAEATRRGLKVYPWTIDDPARMREVLVAGATGIITNCPGVLRRLLDENWGGYKND